MNRNIKYIVIGISVTVLLLTGINCTRNNAEYKTSKVMQFNIIDENEVFYYVNNTLNGYVYKSQFPFNEKMQLTKEYVYRIIDVTKDYIYYETYTENGEDKYLSRVKKDGSEKEEISSEKVQYLAVNNNWIYYLEKDEFISTEDYSGFSHLYRMSMDGNNKQKIEGNFTVLINVSEDWIYYAESKTMHLYRTKVDGSKTEKITDDITTEFHVWGDWIYYINNNDGSNIYKVKIDGTKKQKLNDEDSSFVVPTRDWIYYISGKDSKMYKMRLNGSGRTLTDDLRKIM